MKNKIPYTLFAIAMAILIYIIYLWELIPGYSKESIQLMNGPLEVHSYYIGEHEYKIYNYILKSDVPVSMQIKTIKEGVTRTIYSSGNIDFDADFISAYLVLSDIKGVATHDLSINSIQFIRGDGVMVKSDVINHLFADLYVYKNYLDKSISITKTLDKPAMLYALGATINQEEPVTTAIIDSDGALNIDKMVALSRRSNAQFVYVCFKK